jgi:5,10-methylenetetrahydromethanopterin reductase
MRNPELSISFRAESNEKVLQETAETVGKYGFDVVSVYEDLGDQSPMYPLITLAKHSSKARVGPACVVVPKYITMEPVVGDIARLDSISPGKAYLGLAAGAWMDQVGIKPATVNQLREAADVSRYLLEKRDNGFEGKYYQVKPGFQVNYPTPEGKVPLLVGAWGQRMAALAGEIADEVKVGGSANPLMVDIMRARVNAGTERAGRKPEDVGIVLGAVTVVDNDREKALYLARRKAVVYIDVIGNKDPTAMADFPEEIAAIKTAMAHGDVEGAVEHLPDELTKRFLFAGTPKDIIKQTEEIFFQGASRVEFGSPHGIDGIEGINLLGQEVLPYFEKKGR